jgi:hypothetical protein
VNEISWKEISRSVLIWYALKLLGMADIDIIAHIKGKGHTTTPDSMVINTCFLFFVLTFFLI